MSSTAGPNESYMIGYADYAEAFMTRRSAETHAQFLLQNLRPGMSLLDCGCGPGTISIGLAQAIAPGKFVGIDREPSQIELARQRCQKSDVHNTTFQVENIYQLSFAENSFDVVFSHALLEHLAQPLKAVQEMVRVLKPGGLLALRSPDWGGFIFHPFDTDVAEGLQIFQDRQRANGGNVQVGRELKSFLVQAGLETIVPSGALEFCEPVSYMTHFVAGRIQDTLENHPDKLKILSALRDFHQNPKATFAIAWCEAQGRKRE